MRSEFATVTAIENHDIKIFPIVSDLIPRRVEQVSRVRLGNFGSACNGMKKVFEGGGIRRRDTGADKARHRARAANFKIYEMNDTPRFHFFDVGINRQLPTAGATGNFDNGNAVKPETRLCVGTGLSACDERA